MALVAARRAARALPQLQQHPRHALFSTQRKALQIIESVADFQAARRQMSPTATIGLVPTMGGLHDGHLSLVHAARTQCDIVATSIFVNPTQFGPNEDYSKYPRTFERDVALLQDAGVDFVFCPSASDMFPLEHRCFVTPTGFDDLPEGKCRPGHFRGVATVVTKLLNIVRPTHAFFGAKDAAQCVLIQRVVADLNIDVHIGVVPVCRDVDGLALSTRNQYLAPHERTAASVVYRGLTRARDVFDAHKASANVAETIDAALLRDAIRIEYLSEPLVSEIQYISIASRTTMEELAVVHPRDGAVLSVAVKLGNCRLIDTMTLE